MLLSQRYIRNQDGTVKNVIYSSGQNLEIVYSNLTAVVPWDSQVGGNVSINDFFLEDIYVDPPIISSCGEYIVLGKGSLHSNGFTVRVINLGKRVIYESKKSYKHIALETMSNKIIQFHLACHLNSPEFRRELTFDNENFKDNRSINLTV